MRTLIISGYGIKVGVRNGALEVRSRKGGHIKYSLAEVDQVLITTGGVSITSSAMRAMSDAGVWLVILSSRGLPTTVLYHPFTTRTVAARRGQYMSLVDGKAFEVIKVIAASKILNQAGALRRAARNWGRRDLREDMRSLRLMAERVLRARTDGMTIKEFRATVMEAEAAAARTYWGAYASLLPGDLGFGGRDQDGLDPVNASLNYGYGILYAECFRAVSLAGLDPYAGFLHADRSGKPVLVFDVVEVFRTAAVDYPLLKAFRAGLRPLIKGGLITPESRREVAEVVLDGMKSKFSVTGVAKEVRSWIKTFAYGLASYLRGEAPIKNLVFRW